MLQTCSAGVHVEMCLLTALMCQRPLHGRLTHTCQSSTQRPCAYLVPPHKQHKSQQMAAQKNSSQDCPATNARQRTPPLLWTSPVFNSGQIELHPDHFLFSVLSNHFLKATHQPEYKTLLEASHLHACPKFLTNRIAS